MRKSKSNITGDDVERTYAAIARKLMNLRADMRATYNRFPGQTGWAPALTKLEKVARAVAEARGLDGTLDTGLLHQNLNHTAFNCVPCGDAVRCLLPDKAADAKAEKEFVRAFTPNKHGELA